jgi:hypothetical protein
MGGVECIRSYREWVLQDPHNPDRRANSDMLIIGLSANASGEDRKEAFKYGMHFFCPKPAETSLLATIMRIKRLSTDLKEALEMIRTMSRYAQERGLSASHDAGDIPSELLDVLLPSLATPEKTPDSPHNHQNRHRNQKSQEMSPYRGSMKVGAWKIFSAFSGGDSDSSEADNRPRTPQRKARSRMSI